jgi:hypothetical protein
MKGFGMKPKPFAIFSHRGCGGRARGLALARPSRISFILRQSLTVQARGVIFYRESEQQRQVSVSLDEEKQIFQIEVSRGEFYLARAAFDEASGAGAHHPDAAL